MSIFLQVCQMRSQPKTQSYITFGLLSRKGRISDKAFDYEVSAAIQVSFIIPGGDIHSEKKRKLVH